MIAEFYKTSRRCKKGIRRLQPARSTTVEMPANTVGAYCHTPVMWSGFPPSREWRGNGNDRGAGIMRRKFYDKTAYHTPLSDPAPQEVIEIKARINRILITTLFLLLLFSSSAYASGSSYDLFYRLELFYTIFFTVYAAWVIMSAVFRKHDFVRHDFITQFVFFPAGNILLLILRYVLVFGYKPTSPDLFILTIVIVVGFIAMLLLSILPGQLALRLFLTLKNEKLDNRAARLAYTVVPIICGILSGIFFSPLADFIDQTFSIYYAMELFLFGLIIFFSLVFLAGLFPLTRKIREAGSIKAFISEKEAPG